MTRKKRSRNRGPFLLLVLSGLMMIWGGVGYWTGPGVVGIIGDFLINFFVVNNPMLEFYIHLLVLVCAIFGAFGGFSVILGAFLIYPFGQIFLGKFLVGLGAGMGLISFIFLLVIATLVGLWAILGILWILATNIGWMGVILSIYGRMKIKK